MVRHIRSHSTRRRFVRSARPACFAALALLGPAALSGAQTCSPLMEWNQVALDATVTARQGALPQIRSLAIVHISAHDAVNRITGRYRTYLDGDPAPAAASPDAAVIAAAHYALTRLFGSQAATFDAARASSLAACGLGDSNEGIAVGEAAAAAVLARRASDGSAQAQFPYTAPGAGQPGVFVAEGPAPVVLPGWTNVTPWVLTSGSQFRPGPPPALDSGRYARDFDEVKTLGAQNGSARSTEQTQIAIFWDASPSAIWNSVARGVIAARGLDLSSAARTLALMYMGAADASIACWDAKFTYNFWRPLTAIARADDDGNDKTVADPLWASLVTTHQHPEYPSGHSTNSGAMATVLAMLFGDDPGVPIVASSPRNPTFPRLWTRFSDGVDEVIDARIYIGFHFRTSDGTGARLGRHVAHFVVENALGERE